MHYASKDSLNATEAAMAMTNGRPPGIRQMLLLRGAACGAAFGTFAFLLIGDDWPLSHIFLVPDLVVCIALVAAALLPRSRALPVILMAFGIGVGVFMTAPADYLVQGRFGIGAFTVLATSAIAGFFIIRAL